MKKHSVLLIPVICISLLLCTKASGQTVVYVCSENGAYGICYGNNNVVKCAYDKCVQYGGKRPSEILRTTSKGYGAVAVGKNSSGGQVVGAAAGYRSQQEANNRAIQECQNRGGRNVSVKYTYNDR